MIENNKIKKPKNPMIENNKIKKPKNPKKQGEANFLSK